MWRRVIQALLVVVCVFAFTVTTSANEHQEQEALHSMKSEIVSNESEAPTQTRRSIQGTGFHLTLETRIKLDCKDTISCGECRVGLIEHFPKEAFVDPDQTKELERLGGMGGAKLKILSPFIDIEKPAELSESCDFTVTWQSESSKNENADSTKPAMTKFREAKIPFHLRYQAPNENNYGWVSIPSPIVCSTCAVVDFVEATEDRDVCESHFGQSFRRYRSQRSISWFEEPQVTTVPVGNPQNTDLVVYSTVAVVAAGTFAILFSAAFS